MTIVRPLIYVYIGLAVGGTLGLFLGLLLAGAHDMDDQITEASRAIDPPEPDPDFAERTWARIYDWDTGTARKIERPRRHP